MNEETVRALIRASRADALHDRCLVVSLALRELFGGDLVMYKNPGRAAHFVNSILGQSYDFATDHPDPVDPEILDSPDFLRTVPRIANQLTVFRNRLHEELTRRLPIGEIHHVVIQDRPENPGSYVRPDFSCVLLLGSREQGLDADLFAPGETMWLKFINGPIVARARLVRWIGALRRNWSDEDIRWICRDTVLDRHQPTWTRLAESTASQFLLLFLEKTESLDIPIYAGEHGYGRAIVPLATLADQIAWLDSDSELRLSKTVRPAVRYHPFYRFRWEHELDAEVSQAIDERMPKGGRFFDRVRIVNQGLREYFSLIQDHAEVSTEFTEDELTSLAEIVEDAELCSHTSQRHIVDHTRRIGDQLALDGNGDGVALLCLADHIESLNISEYAALMDTVYTVRTRLYRAAKRSRTDELEDSNETNAH